jgi:hypothetical protein
MPGELPKRVIPSGYQVRKKIGRDDVERVVRIDLTFTFEEWDEIERRAAKRGLFARGWIKRLVLKKLG